MKDDHSWSPTMKTMCHFGEEPAGGQEAIAFCLSPLFVSTSKHGYLQRGTDTKALSKGCQAPVYYVFSMPWILSQQPKSLQAETSGPSPADSEVEPNKPVARLQSPSLLQVEEDETERQPTDFLPF